jgi:hypothetical protein
MNTIPMWRKMWQPLCIAHYQLTVAMHKQAREGHPKKFWLLLFLLLFMVVLASIGIGFYSYFTHYSGAHSNTSTSQVRVHTMVSTPVSPTSLPTQAPTIISTPRPTLSPTPTPVPYPNVAGNFSGTVDDTTASIITGMAIAIQQAGHGVISGYFTVNPPLQGSGKFTGSVNTNNDIQFIVQAAKTNSPLYFWGWFKSNRILNGDYCSLNTHNQCDPNAGASGT